MGIPQNVFLVIESVKLVKSGYIITDMVLLCNCCAINRAETWFQI